MALGEHKCHLASACGFRRIDSPYLWGSGAKVERQYGLSMDEGQIEVGDLRLLQDPWARLHSRTRPDLASFIWVSF